MMKKYGLPLIFVLASLLGIYGQDLAYFLNQYVFDLAQLYYLTIITVLSILLYVFYLFYLLFLYMNKQLIHGGILFTLGLSLLLAILISFWSIFVLAMSWG